MSYDNGIILGLRILTEMDRGAGNYFVKYEFTDANWKQQVLPILPFFLGKNGVKIQTLHPFSSSLNINTGKIQKPNNIWLDNFYITLENLV